MSGTSLRRRRHLTSGALLVFAGGVVGTLLRYGVEVLLPPRSGWPWGTLLANVTGALALGALLETLTRRGPESRAVRGVRLGVGTGVIGGYTTYSTYAVESVRLIAAGQALLGLTYVVVTLLGGLVAAAVGIRFAGRAAGRAAARVARG